MNNAHSYQVKSNGSRSELSAPWQNEEEEFRRSRANPRGPQRFRPGFPRRGKRPPRRIPGRPQTAQSLNYGKAAFAEPEPRAEGSEYVRWVQTMLNQALTLRLPVHGMLDVQTRSAIRSFQEKNGLPVTGVVGPDTERALMAAGSGQSTGGTAQPNGPSATALQPDGTAPAEPASEFEFEWESQVNRSSAEYIRWVQQSLNKIMGLRLAVDGIKGPMTNSAIRSFQQKYGLLADGIVGAQTEGALIKAGSGNPPGSGSSPYMPPSIPTSPYVPPSAPAVPRPAPGGITARILDIARRYIGFQEGPNNTNPFSAYFKVPNVAWCAYFVSYVYTQAGFPLNIGSSDVMLSHLQTRGRFFSNTTIPQPADIVIFDWTQGDHDPAEHVGLVEKVYRNSSGQTRVGTIEGNSADGVNRRDYPLGDSRIVGFGRLIGV